MVESTGAASRKGTRLVGVLIALVAVAILAFMVYYASEDALEFNNRTPCGNNLKQIGYACQQWTMSHGKAWPDDEGGDRWDKVGNTRTDAWSPTRNTGKPPAVEAADNGLPIQSNTAPFWRLVSSAGFEPCVFVCPSVRDPRDMKFEKACSQLRDFRGETFVSYSYQNMLGQFKLYNTTARISTQYAVAADANPMRRDFWSGAPGGVRNGVTDRMLAKKPTFEEDIPEEGEAWNQQVKFISQPWELSSPNHAFKGQNVLYLDGHVEWRTNPYCGTQYDNIWLRRRTDVATPVDPKNIETLRAYNDETSYDGKSTLPENSNDDSFLVP
jgi:prepilin-type processing-associated H-X9-DG protein